MRYKLLLLLFVLGCSGDLAPDILLQRPHNYRHQGSGFVDFEFDLVDLQYDSCFAKVTVGEIMELCDLCLDHVISFVVNIFIPVSIHIAGSILEAVRCILLIHAMCI